MEVLQLGANVLNLIDLGIAIPTLPVSTMGPARFNDNGGHGLAMRVEGEDFALGAGLGIEAHRNTGAGVAVPVLSDDGFAISALARIAANGNGGAGVQSVVQADFLALSAIFDVQSMNNGGDGVIMNVTGDVALGLMGSTDPLRSLAGALNTEMGLNPPLTIPGVPFGPLVASGNAGAGIFADIIGDSLAAGVILDARANNNDQWGVLAEVTADNGEAFAMIGSSDELFQLLPPLLGEALFGDAEAIPAVGYTPMGSMQASGNGMDGLAAAIHGNDGAFLLAGGMEADGNTGSGAMFDVHSANGEVFAGLRHLATRENSDVGIGLFGLGEQTTWAVLDSEASDNENTGLLIDATSTDDLYVILAGLDTHDNQWRGIDVQAAADEDFALAATAIRSTGNYRHGLLVDAEAGGEAFAWVGDLAIEDLRTQFGDFDLFGASETLYNIMSTGPSVFSNNGHDPEDLDVSQGGLRLNIEAQDDVNVVVNGNEANDNRGNGFSLHLESATAGAYAAVDNNTANNNGLNGIRVDTTAATEAGVLLRNNTADENEGAGARVTLDGDTQVLVGERNRFRYNVGYGLYVGAAAGASTYALNFGSVLGTIGNNSIFGNGIDARANPQVARQLMAQGNWWGTATPLPGQFEGQVDYTAPLTEDPNP